MRSAQQFTVHNWPVSAFSARASSGGVKRVSRQGPVHGLAGFGSRRCAPGAKGFLEETRGGELVFDPSIDVSYRVFQNISLPLKKAKLMPALRALSTLARCCPDQYSSWATERNAFGATELVRPIAELAPRRSVSTPAQYLVS